VWEEECRNFLLSVMLQVDSFDVWRWIPDPTAGYTVSRAYMLLTTRHTPTECVPEALLWRKDVPLKVTVFTWRLFRFCLPTNENLYRRGVISHGAQMCVAGCGYQETENHLFHRVPCLVRCGNWSEIGFVFTLKIIIILLIIFISLVPSLVALSRGAPLCICFGSLQSG